MPERKEGFAAAASRLLATGLGAGYSPLVPGSAGSLVGVVSFWALAGQGPLVQLGATLALFAVGVLVSSRTAAEVGLKDPGVVVIDEVVGQWAAFLFLPFTPGAAVLGFLLFRVMDVLKPWPARELESLPGGLGIMADDLMAGAYANLTMRVLLVVLPLA
jgi:phosphatidylglycerophosphatase A